MYLCDLIILMVEDLYLYHLKKNIKHLLYTDENASYLDGSLIHHNGGNGIGSSKVDESFDEDDN